MDIEQLRRARQLQARIERIDEAMQRLNEPTADSELSVWLTGYYRSEIPYADLPAPVRQFKAASLDLLASEKAALEAEFAAL